MENICRTCTRPLKDRTFPVFEENGQLVEKIKTIASVELLQHEYLPSRICSECHSNINTFFNFRKVVITTQTDLNDRLHIVVKSGSYYPKVKHKPEKDDIFEDVDDDIPLSQYLNTKWEEQSDKECVKNEAFSDFDDSLGQQHDNDNYFNENEQDDNQIFVPTVPNNSKSSTKLDKNIQRALYTKQLYKCKDCEEMFSAKRKLFNHRRTAHTAPAVCNICGTTVRADNLKKHIKIHTEGTKECDICGKVFKNTESLRGHKLIHANTFYTCEVCGKQSKLKSEHTRHVKLHYDPDSRKHDCSVCGKKVAELRKHMLTHTGEKPFICTFCNKGLASGYALKVHTRQHTNEKPYICQICSMGFPQKVSLMTHLKSRHGQVLCIRNQ